MDKITPNCIKHIYENIDNAPSKIFPVVQVIQIKDVLPKKDNGITRYRLIISDGVHYMQAMLATNLNPLIEKQELKNYNFLQLTHYVLNFIKERRLVACLNVKVLTNDDTLRRIGNPVNIEKINDKDKSTEVELASANETVAVPASISHQPSVPAYDSTYGQQQQQQHTNHTGNETMLPKSNSFGGWRNNNSSSASMAQRSLSDHSSSVFPISSLNPYQNRWTIKVRVTSKSEIRTWHNARGEGKLFSVNLLDESGEIKATMFQDQVDRLYDVFEENGVYTISKGKVQMAKKQFSSLQNEYELTLDSGTEVERCEDTTSVPTVKYAFVDFSKLMECEKDMIIDVIGVVKEVSPISEIVSKQSQKSVKKRELTLADQSCYSVRLTLWGKQAEQFDESSKPIIAAKGVKVGDYGGRSLSLYTASTLTIDPDIPEAHSLRGWFDEHGQNSNFNSFSGQTIVGAGGQQMSISQVKDEGLGQGDKAQYFTIKATVVFIKQDNISYPGCPDCHKKLLEENDSWHCEKCQKQYPQPEYRYIFSMSVCDYTGQMWLQCFDEIGYTLLGHKADEMQALKDNNPEACQAIFLEASLKTYIFRCRAKQENYQDNFKVRYSVASLKSISYIEEGNELAELIEQF